MKIQIASDMDREKVFAELYIDDYREEWAEVTQETDTLMLTIFPRQDGGTWTFPLEEVLQALQLAKAKLVGGTE